MTQSKKYWSKGDFKQADGTPYVGYVTVENGKAYIHGTRDELLNNGTWNSEFNLSGRSFDRILDDQLKLPHSLGEVQFQANDFLDKSIVKKLLVKLQENNVYLYQQSHLAGTSIPNELSSVLTYGVSSSKQKSVLTAAPFDTDFSTQNSDTFFGDDASFNVEDVLKAQMRVTSVDLNRYGEKRVELFIFILFSDKVVVLRHYYYPDFVLSDTYDSEEFFLWLTDSGLLNIEPRQNESGKWVSPNLEDLLATKNPDGTYVPSVPAEQFFEQKGDRVVLNEQKVARALYINRKVALERMGVNPERYQHNYPLERLFTYWQKEHCGDIDLTPSLGQSNGDYVEIKYLDPANSSSLAFTGLCDMQLQGDFLYIVDCNLDLVASYNVAPLLENTQNWKSSLVKLSETLQGRGSQKDKTYFNRPCAIAVNDSYIYVADGDNHCVKKYSRNLDHQRTIKNASFFSRTIADIALNPYDVEIDDNGEGIPVEAGSLWVLSYTTNYLYLTILANDRVVFNKQVETISFVNESWDWKEKPFTMEFSHSDTQFFYVVTDKNVYKFYTKRPSRPFAAYRYSDRVPSVNQRVWRFTTADWTKGANFDWSSDITESLTATRLQNKAFCLACVDSSELALSEGQATKEVKQQVEGDIVFQLGVLYKPRHIKRYSENTGLMWSELTADDRRAVTDGVAFWLYTEKTTYDNLLESDTLGCFTADDIQSIAPTEYVNAQTVNKLIYKVAYNLVRLKSVLKYRPLAYYGQNHLLVSDGKEVEVMANELRDSSYHNFFINDNEPVSIVINRVFENIWNTQQGVLNVLRTKVTMTAKNPPDLFVI